MDGEIFEVTLDAGQPGQHHFAWLSGPNPGYGFSSRISTHRTMSQDELMASARSFLEQVDPDTGYLE